MAKGIAHYGILFLLSLYTGHVYAMLVSDLLISEVMANPAALADARGEWFELYNPTTLEINLRDVTIGDDGRDSHTFETDLLILPGEYLTLARNVDPGFAPDYVYNNFTLGNGADEIVFCNGLMELLTSSRQSLASSLQSLSPSPQPFASPQNAGPPRKRGTCNASPMSCQRAQTA